MGDTIVFRSGDYDLHSYDTITWQNFQVLDSQITGSSISINTTVPDPGSVVSLMFAGSLVGRRRRQSTTR